MIISSIRLGFANNSSSNHSILLVPNASKLLDSNVSEFGQHSFTLCTPDSKTKYFIAQLMGELSATLHNYEICKNIITDITGITFDETGYVDHQSTWDFPRNFDGKSYNIDFIKDFQEFILKDDVIIEGDDSNTRYTGKFEYPFKEEGGELIVKRAKKDKYTLFNRSNGTKVRLSFDLDSQGKPITKFTSTPTPELIDIKITDYCPYNCFFCTTSDAKISTPNGEIKISEIKLNDIVFGYDIQNKIREEYVVNQIFEREYSGEIISIELDNGRILRLTPEHEVFTQKGWIFASDLTENDELFSIMEI